MKPDSRQQLVDAYFAGELGPQELDDFYVRLALDRDMQLMMQAHRIVDEAIREDYRSIPTEHSNARERIMGLLAVTPAQSAPPLAASIAPPSEESRSSRGRRALPLVLLLLLTLTTTLLLLPHDESPAPKSTTPVPASTTRTAPVGDILHPVAPTPAAAHDMEAGEQTATSTPRQREPQRVAVARRGTAPSAAHTQPRRGVIQEEVIQERNDADSVSGKGQVNTPPSR